MVMTLKNSELPIEISELWESADERLWERRLDHYLDFVKPENLELERAMEQLDMERIRDLDAQGWFDFLLHEYFRWKYTAPNRYASTTKYLKQYMQKEKLEELFHIKERLLAMDPADI